MCRLAGQELSTASKNKDPTPKELQQWVNMMKCMLQCAEISMSAINDMKEKLDFTEEDLKQFEDLFYLLEQIRRSLALMDENLIKLRPPTCDSAFESLSQPPLFTAETFGIRTKEPKTKRDACLCREFTQEVMKNSRKREITICSKINKSLLVNDSCQSCSAQRGEDKATEVEIEEDDDNPFIIKSNGAIDFRGSGLGYEIFYRMKKYTENIAQYIEETNETQTFGEMYRDCISVAVKLQKKGFNEESIICLSVGNSKYACVPYIAGLFVGSQMNALDCSFHVPDIAYLMKMVTPNIIFADNVKIPDIQAALKQEALDVQIVSIGDIEGYETINNYLDASDEEIQNFKPYKTDAVDRICIILFSSGTSGLPKGICLTHQCLQTQIALATSCAYFSRVFMSYTSYYWISAVTFLLCTCLVGVARVVPKAFDVERTYRLIQTYKVDFIFLGPFELVMMARMPQPPDADFSSLKRLATGGAFVKEAIFLEVRRKFPNCLTTQIYGQTEVGGTLTRFCASNPSEVALSATRPASCGVGFGGFWYKVIGKSGRIVGPHEKGELYVKSDRMIMKGYYNLDSSESFGKNGWLRTGDICSYDDYHCFFIVDRAKEVIKYRGWHIPPNLLENILMTHPAVFRAVVIGIPHDEDGEHAMGLIIPNPKVDPQTINLKEIEDFVNSQVDDKKRLRAGVKIIRSIPLTATGKVRRLSLRDAILKGEEIA